MGKTITLLYDLVDINQPDKVLAEIIYSLKDLLDEPDKRLLTLIFSDIVKLFNGQYPGYKASNTQYHDLEHTLSVCLATARLIHAVSLQGQGFLSEKVLNCLAASLFHDVGLIQTETDPESSGAKYAPWHEKRSVEFMTQYFESIKLSKQRIKSCTHLIFCTDLETNFKDIPFESDEDKLLGQIIGSTDLIAQMADRKYLEKLLLLYREFKDSGITEFQSELDLMKQTESFYRSVVLSRLEYDFGNISVNMAAHFKFRWNIDSDLYQDSIQKNIEYLSSILNVIKSVPEDYAKTLRRGGIVEKLIKDINEN